PLLPLGSHELVTEPQSGVSPHVGTGHLVYAHGTPSAPAPVGQPRVEGPAPEEEDEQKSKKPPTGTRTGPTPSGKPPAPRFLHHLAHKAPEQVEGKAGSPASDMFSLATVLVYAATGANPFQGRTDQDTAERLTGPAPDTEDLPILLRTLVAACWNRNPASRPTSAQLLGALTNSEPPPEPPSPAAPRHDPSPETHRTGTFSLPGHRNTPTPCRRRAGPSTLERWATAVRGGRLPPPRVGPRAPGRQAGHSTLERWATAVRGGHVPPPRFGALAPCPQGYPAGIAKIGPDGRLVAVASTGAVCLWDSHTGTHLGEFTGFHEQVHDLAFNAEGTL